MSIILLLTRSPSYVHYFKRFNIVQSFRLNLKGVGNPGEIFVKNSPKTFVSLQDFSLSFASSLLTRRRTFHKNIFAYFIRHLRSLLTFSLLKMEILNYHLGDIFQDIKKQSFFRIIHICLTIFRGNLVQFILFVVKY